MLYNQVVLEEARKSLSHSERLVKDLESQYGLLTITDKFHYRESPQKYRKLYESQRIRFFRLEDEELRQGMGQSDLDGLKIQIGHTNSWVVS